MADLFEQLVCDEPSRQALVALAANPPRSPLVVISGPGDLPAQAAHAVALGMVRSEARELDVRVARPLGDRWSIAEVHEQIIAPSHLRAIDRSVIVVDRAESMDVAAAEHLLKTVEEPPAGCIFIFAVASQNGLLPTLRSRVAVEVVVNLASPATRAAGLASRLNIDLAIAQSVVDRCGVLTALAERVLVAPDDKLGALDVFATPVFSLTPTTSAVSCVAMLEALAQLGDPFDVQGVASKNDAVVRSRVRTLARHLLACWASQVSAELASEKLDRFVFAKCVLLADAIDEAHGQLVRYAPTRNVLAALLMAASSFDRQTL